jgi:hypothetical protein
MELPTLELDRSDAGALYLKKDGTRVDLEDAFKHGFMVTPNDCPAILSLVAQFHLARDQNQK